MDDNNKTITELMITSESLLSELLQYNHYCVLTS